MVLHRWRTFMLPGTLPPMQASSISIWVMFSRFIVVHYGAFWYIIMHHFGGSKCTISMRIDYDRESQ
ncbi:MAG: hypothetical protein LKH12_01215, partial [Prevotella sp.]